MTSVGYPYEPFNGEESSKSKLETHRVRGKEAQKRFRQKNKEKFEILEHEVLAMSDHLRSLEKQKADLKAQIKELQPQISRHPQPCLPDIDKVEPPFMPAVSWANFNPEGKGGIILKTIYEQPRKLTRDQAVAMPLEDMQLIMLEFVARSGQLLVDHSEQDLQDSSTLPGAKLKELLKERSGLCCSLVCWTPFKMLLLRDRGFLHVTSTSSLSPPTYSCILRKLELSSAQKRALHTAGRQYSDKVQSLFSEREVLKGMLEGLSLERAADGGVRQLDVLMFANVVRKLVDNIDTTFIQKSILWATTLLMLESLSYTQELRWWLESFPSFPDPFHLYKELDKEMAKQSSKALQTPQDSDIKADADLLDEALLPYVEMEAKMIDAFASLGLWHMLGGEELASSLSRRKDRADME